MPPLRKGSLRLLRKQEALSPEFERKGPKKIPSEWPQTLPTRSSFSTVRRERRAGLSHLRQTLNPGVPVLPWSASLDALGQWPVCHTGASPTEDPSLLFTKDA